MVATTTITTGALLAGSRGMTIGPARRTDAGEVWAVVDAAFARYRERMEGPPAPVLADYARLAEAGRVTVARQGRRVVAVLVHEVTGRAVEIDTLAVHPSHEGRGLASLLLDHAIDAGLAAEAHAVTLYTNAVMEEAQSFWLARGFRQTGRRVEDGYDRLYYRRCLRPEGAPA